MCLVVSMRAVSKHWRHKLCSFRNISSAPASRNFVKSAKSLSLLPFLSFPSIYLAFPSLPFASLLPSSLCPSFPTASGHLKSSYKSGEANAFSYISSPPVKRVCIIVTTILVLLVRTIVIEANLALTFSRGWGRCLLAPASERPCLKV